MTGPKPRQSPTETPAQLTVTAWRDPLIEARGHRPGSPYIEAVWLGILGPSTTLAWACLARAAARCPQVTIDTADLAVSLGLGDGLGRNDPISRTLARMVAFGAASRQGDTLAVRLALPDVPERATGRLSRSATHAHQRLAHSHQPAPEPPAVTQQAISR